jgi:DNA-directed RNA polymerase subunit RPC12/RpoP
MPYPGGAHAPSFGSGIQTVAASLPRSENEKRSEPSAGIHGPGRFRRLLTLGLCVLSELADFEIVTLEAKCAACGHTFDHPSFGQQMYGHMLFCAENGKFYAHFDANGAVAALVTVMLPDVVAPQVYQAVLAHLADPIFGQKLTPGIRCPSCRSDKLAYWGGRDTGTIWVKPATHRALLALSRNELVETIRNAARDV